MKRSRLTEEQIIAILRVHEASVPAAEVCRRHGVSSATFYKWMAKFGGLEVSGAKRRTAGAIDSELVSFSIISSVAGTLARGNNRRASRPGAEFNINRSGAPLNTANAGSIGA